MTTDSIADASLRETQDADADPIQICATCNAGVEDSAWHPVSTRTTDTGEVVVYLFCTDACKAQWQATHN